MGESEIYMDMPSAITESKQVWVIEPVYCKECKGRNTWKRFPDRDIKGESGKILFERWKCQGCGAETIYPSANL